MISDNIVFVVGAGGSMSFNFPSGQVLIELILQDLEIEYTATELAPFGFDKNIIEEFRISLLRSNLASIDQFLVNRPEFIHIGKLAITRILTKFERNNESLLFKTKTNWLKYLWHILIAKNSLDDLLNNKICFLTFNYDRIIEHFFFTSIKNTFGLNDDQTSIAMQKFPIFHIYGQLGNLQWQNEELYRPFSDFIGKYNNISEVSSEIKIIYEKPDLENTIIRAKGFISRADKIYFLGNGYHEMNMKLLDIENNVKSKGITFGTAFGFTISEINSLNRKFPYINLEHRGYDILEYFRNAISLNHI